MHQDIVFYFHQLPVGWAKPCPPYPWSLCVSPDLKKLKYSDQSPRPKHRKADEDEQEKFKQTLPLKVKKIEQKYPLADLDVWFFDEHRVGLKPILRKVWSPIGERPTAIVSHRYEWLYVYGFVKLKTGETLWYLIPRVNTLWLNLVYQNFAVDAGISEKKSFIDRR
nr:winged helix-turn-helix domain-containing protein [Moorena sp. SIO3I6]